ncbi:MAG TPA: hypothetical protein VFV94_18020, partial [Polyangiaceae bacterium]|nr:hypothetical protein [Polyangiaceae bacterium]
GRDPFSVVAERTIEGHVVRTASGYDADLTVRTSTDQLIGQRRVSTAGEDCTALGGAVTLAVVLTIDPNAALEPNQPSASFPIDQPPSPPPLPPVAPFCAETPAPPSERATPCPPPPSPRAIPGTLVAAAGALGPLPRFAPGVALDVSLPVSPITPVFGARILVPVTTDDGHLQLGLDTLGLGACAKVASSAALALGLCAGAEGGIVTVVARDLTPVNAGPFPWVALDAGLRLIVRSSSLVRFHAGAVALFPLIRQEFQVDSPGATGFQSSAVGGLLFAGAELGGT